MPRITRTNDFGFDEEVKLSDAEFAERENELLRAEIAARDEELAQRAKPGAQIITEGIGQLLYGTVKVILWIGAGIIIGSYVFFNFL